MVKPFMSPVTVQLKVKVSPGQVGAVVNCPVTIPIKKGMDLKYLLNNSDC